MMNAATPENLLYAFIGCLLGTLVGVLPGLGAVSTVAILFPFTSYLPPTGMVIVMAAIYYGAMYGGSTTAILVNVPGEVPSVVTCLDGYQMTKKGRAGPALAIAAITSFEAGVIGCVFIALLGPSLAQYALSFGPAEYLGLGLFSLTAIAGLSGNSMLRGAIVAVVGMLLVISGYDVGSNLSRLTFGIQALLQGLEIVPVMIPVSSAVGLVWEPTASLALGVSAQLGFVLEWAPGAPPRILLYVSPGVDARWFFAEHAGLAARLGWAWVGADPVWNGPSVKLGPTFR